MIAPFDIGGRGLYRYTYRMKCEEASELGLDDGAVRIFLNTRGRHPELVSEELVELLHYFEHTTTETSEQCTSKRIKTMHQRIEKLRSNEEVRMRYLRELEDRMEARKEAREEGLAEGRAEGRAAGHAAGLAEAREEYIRIFVLDKLEDGVEPEKILSKLQRLFQLSEEAANEHFTRFSGEASGAVDAECL